MENVLLPANLDYGGAGPDYGGAGHDHGGADQDYQDLPELLDPENPVEVQQAPGVHEERRNRGRHPEGFWRGAGRVAIAQHEPRLFGLNLTLNQAVEVAG